MNFDLHTNKAPYSTLNGDDLNFFYNHVGVDSEMNYPMMYDWEKVISQFPEVDIDSCNDEDEIDRQPKENIMRFSLRKRDMDNKAMAFFRHLRNAFSHYNIEREGEWYIIKDYEPNDKNEVITCIGKIKVETLKSICSNFFIEREQMLNENL